MYNLAWQEMKAGNGTHFYNGRWSVLDQIIVSGNILSATKGLTSKTENFRIVEDDFLFKTNRKGNKVPLRTYTGPKYIGGYSDHLPVVLELSIH